MELDEEPFEDEPDADELGAGWSFLEMILASGVWLLEPLYPSLYQPPPLRTNEVALMSFWTLPLSQASHGGGSAPIF